MAERLNSKVASSCVTLVDDGRIPWKAGTGSWDAEGVPTGRTLLIKDGIACSYLYNLQYAWEATALPLQEMRAGECLRFQMLVPQTSCFKPGVKSRYH